MAKLFESVTIDNHQYILYCGELIYKRWISPVTKKKTEPSMIFNKHWPNEKVITTK